MECSGQFPKACPSRALISELADKWSILALCSLVDAPQRFNAMKRTLEGISQKSLTQTLRRLERNGLLSREVIQTSPIGVQYALTELGRSLLVQYKALYDWTHIHMDDVQSARASFDERLKTA